MGFLIRYAEFMCMFALQIINNVSNSTSHKNTIEGDFTHTGVGVITDEEGKLYFTQLFFKK